MTEDPGKTRATYAALLFLLIIYGGGYFFARINNWIEIKAIHKGSEQPDPPYFPPYNIIIPEESDHFSKVLLYFYKPLTFAEIEIRNRMH